jgi:competence protein ComEC
MRHFKFSPVINTALGAAIGFYCSGLLQPVQIIFIFVILLVVLCFFRVLASFYPVITANLPSDGLISRRLQLTAVYCTTLAVGLSLGISAAGSGIKEAKFGIPDEKIIALEGILLEDPRIISGGRAMAVLSLSKCAGEGGLRVSSSGKVTVFFPEESALKLREFGRKTTVFAEGQLIYGNMGWTYSAVSMHVIKTAPVIERIRTGIRLNLISRFEGRGFSDAGGLALALLLGIRDNLDTNLTEMYRKAGCSYILALSGMHLAVLASLIAFLLKKPLGLKAAAITGAVIICLYCFIVGPMPSLNRSALMYLLGVFAIIGMLPREPFSVLCLSFLIQLIITPEAGNTFSFILSYLALAGILIIGQSLYSLLAGKIPDFILQSLSASCGAFLVTAGVVSFSFGMIAPVGIIAGLFIAPVTTVFMIGSMIWLVFDLFSLSGFLDLPILLIYRLKELIVTFAGRVPGIVSVNPLFILIFSLVLSLLIIILEYRRRTALLRLRPFP